MACISISDGDDAPHPSAAGWIVTSGGSDAVVLELVTGFIEVVDGAAVGVVGSDEQPTTSASSAPSAAKIPRMTGQRSGDMAKIAADVVAALNAAML